MRALSLSEPAAAASVFSPPPNETVLKEPAKRA
jgi:hypothetical protein